MPSIEQDWAFVRAAVPDLKDYLLSKELYWPVTGAPRQPVSNELPRLTIGNLLLALRRLQGANLDGQRRSELERLMDQVSELRTAWRAHWEQKAADEYRARLGRWSSFVQEINSNRPPSQAEYAYQVRLRALLDLLRMEISESMGVEAVALDNLDADLRRKLDTSAFIWEPEVEQAFPPDKYWYLHGALR